MKKRGYPSDLTDVEYRLIESILPARKTVGRTGRPPRYTYREICNGILYAERTGCAWRYLPKDLPHWTSVYAYWRQWNDAGVLNRVLTILRESELTDRRGLSQGSKSGETPSRKGRSRSAKSSDEPPKPDTTA